MVAGVELETCLGGDDRLDKKDERVDCVTEAVEDEELPR